MPGVGFQGGIRRSSATEAMSPARFLAWSNVSSEKGATWPGWWHSRQRARRIGSTSPE
jgi:hypothetical protein